MTSMQSQLNRRQLLGGTLAAGLSPFVGEFLPGSSRGEDDKTVTAGRIKQSICFWCFNTAGEKWDAEKTCQVARDLGCRSVELIGPESWDLLKKYGLICAMAPNGMPGAPFVKGYNNPKYHEELITRAKQSIDACSEAGFPSVIAFTGYKWREAEDPKSGEISREEGAEDRKSVV